jgi:hypothetical protein
VQLVSTLGSVVISARAELASIIRAGGREAACLGVVEREARQRRLHERGHVPPQHLPAALHGQQQAQALGGVRADLHVLARRVRHAPLHPHTHAPACSAEARGAGVARRSAWVEGTPCSGEGS